MGYEGPWGEPVKYWFDDPEYKKCKSLGLNPEEIMNCCLEERYKCRCTYTTKDGIQRPCRLRKENPTFND